MVYKEHIPPPNILFHIHATQPSKYSCILTRKSSSEQSISEVHQPHLTTTTSSVVQAQFTPTSSHSHRYLIILSISQSVIHPPWRPPQQWHQHQYQRPPAPPHPPHLTLLEHHLTHTKTTLDDTNQAILARRTRLRECIARRARLHAEGVSSKHIGLVCTIQCIRECRAKLKGLERRRRELEGRLREMEREMGEVV